MRILIINEVLGWSSTGKIAGDLAKQYEAQGWEAKVAYGRSGYVPEAYQKYGIRIGNDPDVRINALKARLFDNEGLNAKGATRRFLKWAEEYNPDLLWLHNLHGYYINYELLFDWIKSRPQMEVKWTLHDCWAFTGHCVHFTMVKCTQWQSHCGYSKCPQSNRYPKSILWSNAKENFKRKREAFTGVRNLTIVTPSHWLEGLVKQSFLQEYPVEVHHNTINTDVFKPTPSDFRRRYGLEDKIVILGVANAWDDRKGLQDFCRLATMLDDRYAIVLVGLTQKQIKKLPKEIKGMQKTYSPTELAAIYTAADVYVNPSREETYGMTTVEAEACGTKAIVYKGTACEEVVASVVGDETKESRSGGTATESAKNKLTQSAQNETAVSPGETDRIPVRGIAVELYVNALYEAITGQNYEGMSGQEETCKTGKTDNTGNTGNLNRKRKASTTGKESHKTGGALSISRFVCIPKTDSTEQLVAIYTAADYFVNPTYEDNYPTVNLEALACGTSVITYDTGGCRETLQKNEQRNF